MLRKNNNNLAVFLPPPAPCQPPFPSGAALLVVGIIKVAEWPEELAKLYH